MVGELPEPESDAAQTTASVFGFPDSIGWVSTAYADQTREQTENSLEAAAA